MAGANKITMLGQLQLVLDRWPHAWTRVFHGRKWALVLIHQGQPRREQDDHGR